MAVAQNVRTCVLISCRIYLQYFLEKGPLWNNTHILKSCNLCTSYVVIYVSPLNQRPSKKIILLGLMKYAIQKNGLSLHTIALISLKLQNHTLFSFFFQPSSIPRPKLDGPAYIMRLWKATPPSSNTWSRNIMQQSTP